MRQLVAAMTVLLCLCMAPAASAGAPPEFYGVVASDDPAASDFDRMGTAKVGVLRLNFTWASVQPTGPETYDWARYDQLIGKAAEKGLRVLPTVYASPSWVSARFNHPPSQAHMAQFEAFVRTAAERYGSNGLFWTLNPQLPKLPIIEWQIWNEVSSPTFWLPNPKPKQYKPMLVAADRALAQGDPSAKLVLAGLFPAPVVRRGVRMDRYLTGLYRSGARTLFDAVAIHPYATTPRKVLDPVRDAREIMRRFGDNGKPILLTEVGWPTGGKKNAFTVTPGTQAKFLRQLYKLAGANRKRLKIETVLWFSLRDVPSRIWFYNTGLLTRSGAPKPAWKAFAALTGGTP
jgi:Beta-galactosidase